MRRIWKRISYIVLTVFVIQAAVCITYLFTYKNEKDANQELHHKFGIEKQREKVEEAQESGKENKITVLPGTIDEALKLLKPGKKEVDLSKINVSQEVEELIKSIDVKNAENNIIKYKKAIVEFDIPEGYQKEILKQVSNGKKLSDILIAYNFLNDEYGKIDELEKFLNKKDYGMDWARIFTEYVQKNKEFIPRTFESGYLDKLMKTPGITIDDLMIADKLSQKGLAKFEDIIELKIQGKIWKDIKSEFNIINLEEKLTRVTITEEQVQKYVISSGMDKQQVVDALVIAAKMNYQIEENASNSGNQERKDDESVDVDSKYIEEIIKKVKECKGKEDIYAEIYSKKYE